MYDAVSPKDIILVALCSFISFLVLVSVFAMSMYQNKARQAQWRADLEQAGVQPVAAVQQVAAIRPVVSMQLVAAVQPRPIRHLQPVTPMMNARSELSCFFSKV